MKSGTKIVLLVIIIGIVYLIYAGYNQSSGHGEYDTFAQCLTEKGVTMYGSYLCPHCKNQKEAFGKSFDYVNYVECELHGNNANPKLCREKGIKGYPTWEFANDEMISGELTLREIAFRSGCNLN